MSSRVRVKSEFALTDNDFRFISDTIYKFTGISLGEHKRELVYSRLARRLREHKLATFKAYCDLVNSPQGEMEIEHIINALTTNLTSFFREAHHFDHLRQIALPELAAAADRRDGRIRLWSSACSTGEEPYSIAMSLMWGDLAPSNGDIRLLATDLNTNVLKRAEAGVYGAATLAKLPQEYRSYFDHLPEGDVRIKSQVKEIIRFRQLNLLATWPMCGPFDIIFCRNVLIYFDAITKSSLVDRFTRILRPGGWLYLGHSESASGNHPMLELTGHTTYRRRM